MLRRSASTARALMRLGAAQRTCVRRGWKNCTGAAAHLHPPLPPVRLRPQVPTLWLDSALCSFCAQLNDARAHDLVTFIDGIVDVCEDAAWMSRPATGQRLCSLADFAASKFDICDCVMHAK